MSIVPILTSALLLACGSKSDPPPGDGTGTASGSSTPKSTASTPGAFFSRGLPTYIVGTSGDDRSDRAIAGQAELARSLLTPDAKRIADTEIDLKKGPTAWPANPVVYGGAHVNAVIARLAAELPFSITAGKLTIGDQVFESDTLALITVVPAREGKYPEFMLYAGTATPGIEEINNGSLTGRVEAPIVIADAFGPFVVGTWHVGPDGIARPKLDKPRRRVGWRETVKDVAGVKVAFKFFDGVPAADDDAAIRASTRGIEIAVKKLAATAGLTMTVYVHPDQRSKKTLTGDGGHGHAVGFARTLHVYYLRPPDPLESLVAHEATHVLTWQMFPPPGSSLFGEGVAVWVAGSYAGESLAKLRTKLRGMKPAGSIRDLLGAKFRALPEGLGYPIAGILVEVAIEKVGFANVRDHLYGATPATWDEACKRAGTTADALDAALDALTK